MKRVCKCDFCAECFTNETEAIAHEDKCGYNPKNKIKDRTVFRLAMILESLPEIIACALHEVAADKLDYLQQETERANSYNCPFMIKRQKDKILRVIVDARDVMRKHNGRNSCTNKDVAKENPELLKAMIDTLTRKAWNEW